MIERKFNKDIPFDKIRLHSSERNQSWNDLFELFKTSINDSDIRYYPNLDKRIFNSFSETPTPFSDNAGSLLWDVHSLVFCKPLMVIPHS